MKKRQKSSAAHGKDMTVSELAIIVAGGFKEMGKEMDERFDQVNMQFDQVDKRFEQVDARFTVLEHKVDRIQDSVNELNFESRKVRTRLENLEFKVFGSIQEP